jgi:rRNA-processing protein FCF1
VRSVPQAPTALFFKYNTALGPPYQVLLDTNFLNFSIKNKLDVVRAGMDCLLAKVIPCITDCVLAELEKLGPKYRVALRIAKDPRFERIPCEHKGTYADDCLVNRVTEVRGWGKGDGGTAGTVVRLSSACSEPQRHPRHRASPPFFFLDTTALSPRPAAPLLHRRDLRPRPQAAAAQDPGRAHHVHRAAQVHDRTHARGIRGAADVGSSAMWRGPAWPLMVAALAETRRPSVLTDYAADGRFAAL